MRLSQMGNVAHGQLEAFNGILRNPHIGLILKQGGTHKYQRKLRKGEVRLKLGEFPPWPGHKKTSRGFFV